MAIKRRIKRQSFGTKTLYELSKSVNKTSLVLKQDLVNATHLAHPVPNAKLALHVDASNFAIGAVLHQIVDGEMQPLCFYSKRMTETQKRYTTYDRELLAVYQAMKYNLFMIEGRECTVYTDHKPLTFAFKPNKSKKSKTVCERRFIFQFNGWF